MSIRTIKQKNNKIMSKAAEKRAKDEYNKAYRTMNSSTIALRERFYGAVVHFHTKQLQNRVDLLWDKRGETTDSRQIKDLDQSIRRIQGQLDRKFTNQLDWVADAKENFDAKIANVSQKLVGFGLTKGYLTVKDTWIESAQEMSFLITGEIYQRGDNDFLGTAHARLIWVNCTEKASHWRFICTLRDKPGTVNNPTQEKAVEVDTKQSKKEQIMILFNAGKSTKDIQMLIGGHISYIRNIIRTNK
jgi:hypothetical protein